MKVPTLTTSSLGGKVMVSCVNSLWTIFTQQLLFTQAFSYLDKQVYDKMLTQEKSSIQFSIFKSEKQSSNCSHFLTLWATGMGLDSHEWFFEIVSRSHQFFLFILKQSKVIHVYRWTKTYALGSIDTLSIQYRYNSDRKLSQYQHNINKKLIQYCYDINTKKIQYQYNIVTILIQYR